MSTGGERWVSLAMHTQAHCLDCVFGLLRVNAFCLFVLRSVSDQVLLPALWFWAAFVQPPLLGLRMGDTARTAGPRR